MCNENNISLCEMKCFNIPPRRSDFSIGKHILYGTLRRCFVTAPAGETVCGVDMENIAEPIVSSIDRDIPVELYIQMMCTRETRVVITNHRGIVDEDVVTFFTMSNCVMYWKDLAQVGQALDLRVIHLVNWQDEYLTGEPQFHECVEEMQEANFTEEMKQKGIRKPIKGLHTLGTFSINSNVSVPVSPLFMDRFWPVMAEITAVNISFGQENLLHLSLTCPTLQSLDIVNDRLITQPPLFPWSTDIFNLPRNISRSEKFQNHYVTSEGLTMKRHVYRRILNIKCSNLSDLSNIVFRGFLHKVELSNDRITHVGVDTFRMLTGLQILDISHNLLVGLPEMVFKGLDVVRQVLLHHNSIEYLAPGMFDDLLSLAKLDLGHNRLKTITQHYFGNTPSLTRLDYSYNMLEDIDTKAVDIGVSKLTQVVFSHNQLKYIPFWVYMVRDLANIDLSYNNITFENFVKHSIENGTLQYTIIHFENTRSVSEAEITFEPLMEKHINLSYNHFIRMDTAGLTSNTAQHLTFLIILNFFNLDLTSNDIACDCTMIHLYKLLKQQYLQSADLSYTKPRIKPSFYQNLICSSPSKVKGIPVVSLQPSSLQCEEDMPLCPDSCICYRRVIDKAVVVHCDNSSIKEIPQILPKTTISLSLAQNQIKQITKAPYYLKDLHELDLSNNNLTVITGKLFYEMNHNATLYLHGNKLRTLPNSIYDLPIGLKITLRNNRFVCDCNNVWLYEWILKHAVQGNIEDVKQVICSAGTSQGQTLVEANRRDFVCDRTTEIMAGSLVGICIVLVFLVLCVYRYRGEIKLYLYTRFDWHPFDLSDDSDIVDKQYDAFVSYNTKDYKWVCHTLRSQLENISSPYKLCIHDRDFIVGAPIEENIMNSIKYSRRMIMVLSNNFLKSDWCILEFRSAHLRAMKERSNYLIVVLYSEVSLDDLDDDLKLYLKTNTYLTVDNKWFWDKLRYAMPHTPLDILKQKVKTKVKKKASKTDIYGKMANINV